MAERMTIKEIARLAGVNISTVSRALNPATADKISRGQREKILALCDRYNYRPRIAARGCATGRSFRVGLVLGDITSDLASPLQALYTRGLCSVLQAEGYTLSILWAEQEPAKRDEAVRHFLMSEIADGYILGAPLLAPQTLETFSHSGRPILSFKTLQAEENKFPTLEFDPLNSFRRIWKAMPQELAENILFTGPECHNTLRKKELFCSCSEKAALVKTLYYPLEQDMTAFHHDYLRARNFFSSHLDALLNARLICCASDLVAHAACDELASQGRKVGEDIFVLGYDNMEGTTPYPGKAPCLSTTDPHWEEAGRASARFILDALQQPKQDRSIADIVIKSSYICRSSFPFDLPEDTTYQEG
ncbi:MAG: LacI family DNA-binding transcriptional regulator [Lentisphaeria bacterium]|nr:LacI family DNA-binding transcriptional regulator [Lentisphaeria bacterium]